MDTRSRPSPEATLGCFIGCIVALILLSGSTNCLAQTQLPLPSASKERQESKIDNGKEPKLDRPRPDEGQEKKNDGNEKKVDEDEEKSKDAEKKDGDKKEAAKESLLNPHPPMRRLTIGECIQIAHERSPILKSLRNRLESAMVGQRGIETTSRYIHNLIAPDLQYRRAQAARGVQAAEAELFQSHHDVTFNVIRTYYTAVYAKEQFRVASEIEKQFKQYLELVKSAVAEGSDRNIDQKTELLFVQYVARAVDKRIQAEAGYFRAMEGLKHELSVGDDFPFAPADDVLPEVSAEIDPEHAVALALHKRGEIALAKIGVDVLELEVLAQGAVRFRLRQSTAAAASDVHARQVPLGTRDGEYRPDAISPDFPTLIVGDKHVRAERASSLLRGQETLLEKTRDLVKLETMNAVIRSQEGSKRVPELKQASDAAIKLVDRIRKDQAESKTISERIITVEGTAAETKGIYNEARYQRLMAIASLERATAGGIRANYPGR